MPAVILALLSLRLLLRPGTAAALILRAGINDPSFSFAFVLRSIYAAVYPAAAHKLFVPAKACGLPLVQDQYVLGKAHRAYALSYHYYGGIGKMFGQRTAQLGVGFIIQRAGGIVQDKDFRMGGQCPCDKQTLLLSA